MWVVRRQRVNNIQSHNEYTVGSGIKTTNIVSYKINSSSFSTSIS